MAALAVFDTVTLITGKLTGQGNLHTHGANNKVLAVLNHSRQQTVLRENVHSGGSSLSE